MAAVYLTFLSRQEALSADTRPCCAPCRDGDREEDDDGPEPLFVPLGKRGVLSFSNLQVGGGRRRSTESESVQGKNRCAYDVYVRQFSSRKGKKRHACRVVPFLWGVGGGALGGLSPCVSSSVVPLSVLFFPLRRNRPPPFPVSLLCVSFLSS